MTVFWERGYEGSSIADLTEAMGITAPSLYGAFTSKAELYRQTLEHYQGTAAVGARLALEAPTLREALARMLEGAAQAFTDSRHPRGCMISTAVLTCATENQPVARHVAGLRDASLEQLRARFQQALAQGELPVTTDIEGLARFYGAIIQGMSVQALDGASGEDLRRLTAFALSCLPARG